MRLIDADKLLAQYKARCEGCKETQNYCEHCCDIADVISDIEDAPTIEERKKGKWVRDEFGSKCSCCGLYAYRNRFGLPWESNFCPNCGADMREGQT